MTEELETLRSQIDALDRQIVELLNERAKPRPSTVNRSRTPSANAKS